MRSTTRQASSPRAPAARTSTVRWRNRIAGREAVPDADARQREPRAGRVHGDGHGERAAQQLDVVRAAHRVVAARHVARLAGARAAGGAVGEPLAVRPLHRQVGHAHGAALERGRGELVAVPAERRVAQVGARAQRHRMTARRRRGRRHRRRAVRVAARAADPLLGTRPRRGVAVDAELPRLDPKARAVDRVGGGGRVGRDAPALERGAMAVAAGLRPGRGRLCRRYGESECQREAGHVRSSCPARPCRRPVGPAGPRGPWWPSFRRVGGAARTRPPEAS